MPTEQMWEWYERQGIDPATMTPFPAGAPAPEPTPAELKKAGWKLERTLNKLARTTGRWRGQRRR